MDLSTYLPSEYDRRARLVPTLLLIVPAVLAGACWFQLFTLPQIATGLCLLTFIGILAQLGRDRGKKLEPLLFTDWGGKPSVQLLRHRSTYLTSETRERYHNKLRTLMPETRIPSLVGENTDPNAADVIYESCSTFLRTSTRDTQKFRLLFEENISFGFRRNLLAMKPAGIFLSILGFVAAGLATITKSDSAHLAPFPAVATLVNGIMLALWLFRFNREWVRIPAFAYAERLLEACEVLQPPASKSTGIHIP